MAAELAGDLVDGDACPVCGSCEHPSPAERGTTAVTADDIEAAEVAATAAMSARSALESRVASTRATDEAQRSELQVLLEGRDPSRLDDELVASRATLGQAQAAASVLPRLGERLQQLRAERDALTGQVDSQRQAVATALTRAEAARGQAARAAESLAQGLREHAALCPCTGGRPGGMSTTDAAEAPDGAETPDEAALVGRHRVAVRTHRAATVSLRRLGEALGTLVTTTRTADATRDRLTAALTQHGFADVAAARAALLPADELARMTAQLRAIDTQRDQAEALLAQPEVSAAEQQPAPDLEALARVAATARDEATRARRAQTIAESAEHRLHDLAGEVHAILERIGPAEAEQAVVQELADCVAGTSANNTLRMRLSSYVLAARLEEVARLANERLQVMTEGRYTLVYSDALARRGARSGLGLRVVDAWTGASRETSTLSGGESFMASLALALGLGDAVRAEAGGFDLADAVRRRGLRHARRRQPRAGDGRARQPARGRTQPWASSATSASCASASPPSCGSPRARSAPASRWCPPSPRWPDARGRGEPRGHAPLRHVPAGKHREARSCPRWGAGTGLAVDPLGWLLLERLRRRAGADQVAVAVRAVDPADRRPVLGRRVDARPGRPPSCRSYGCSHSPASASRRVRRAAQRVVGRRPLAAADPVDLAADRDHRVAEPVELAEVLALGRLDHQRAGHRERHRRRVEAVVDQPLGDVVDGDAGRPW